jgi:hypothetical protein
MKRPFVLFSTLVVSVICIAPPAGAASASKDQKVQYAASIGIGTGIPISPDEFTNDFDPSFGLVLDVEASKWWMALSASAGYNFFFSNGLEPNDANILALFLNLKIKPLSKSSLRPYLLVGGGYFRYWVVNLDLTDNTTGWQYGGGAEMDIGKRQRLFIDAKYVEGRTRETNAGRANTVYVPIRVGLMFVF